MMAEKKEPVVFTHREIAEVLVERAGVTEGHWGLFIEFGLQAVNAVAQPGAELLPAALVPVTKLGIQRFEAPNSLTVDAGDIAQRAKQKAVATKRAGRAATKK